MKNIGRMAATVAVVVVFCEYAEALHMGPPDNNDGKNAKEEYLREMSNETKKVLEHPADATQEARINALREIINDRLPVEHNQFLALAEQIVLGYNRNEPADAGILRRAAYLVLQRPPFAGDGATQRAREIFQDLGEYYGPGEGKDE